MRDTRAELLSQAEILVRGRGYAGFSYADLAGAVGIRKASIHHHFPTKVDLGAALVAAYAARYDGALTAIGTAVPDGPGRIAAYGRLYLGGVEQGLGCLCAALAIEGEALPERLRADIAAFFETHLAWLETILRAGQADGSVQRGQEPAALARYVIATLEGALLMERLFASPAAFSGTLAVLVDGLRPR
ncbi:TetR/AcrR family transcriptional regulator [Methylobacterium sp. WL64]|uniref:TetR/AcrR family transcriptional regulator n=1 Tax=Methylobacterium sp. WL64 TaxID=2603894 RepID=UPI0011CBA357|nr:TetR family transcriptional regulator C-terminal domain-containing protein [Methylobacterium sp. WL64]TXN04521.1 TetR/AcrR family transcriptional regulator [Methylobacterium sp. WL64]